MQLVTSRITVDELKEMSKKMYGDLVKAFVDVEKAIMAIDADMHADEEFFLLEQGSDQEYLWGINLFPDLYGTENFIVFDSMINLRPSQGNRSRNVEDPNIQKKIRTIVSKLVTL